MDAAPEATPSQSPARPRRLRVILRIAALLVLVYLAWVAAVAAVQRDLLFPRHLAGAPLANPPAGAEQIWLTTPDGLRVEALFFAGRGRSADSPGPAVLYAHGNAELIDQCGDVADMYRAWGVSVLIPEYRGYGRSGGTPSQRGIVEDFVAFHGLLSARPEVEANAIVLHGRSLGGGVAAQLAARERPAALIVESTFTSVLPLARGYGVPSFAVLHPFRTDQVLPELAGVPILIMHGRADTIIPVSHGQELHRIAPWSEYYETDDDHNTFPRDRRAYRDRVREFLRDLIVEP